MRTLGACYTGGMLGQTTTHTTLLARLTDGRDPARLKTESGKKAYAKRAHLAETPDGFIKQVIGLRQFLLRGLDKVRTEWL